MKHAMSTNKLIILHILLVFSFYQDMRSQVKSIGLPLVQNIPTDLTGAGRQTWDIIQDDDGVMYFANESGVLIFDSEEWTIMPVSNNSVVSSIALGHNNRVYVGAYSEIGFIERSSPGKVKYYSLKHLIPEEYHSFDVVWDVYHTRYGIIFQSYEYVFILDEDVLVFNEDSVYTTDNPFMIIEPQSRFGFSYYLNNNYYIIESGIGLRIYNNGRFETVSDAPLFSEDEIRFILPFKSNTLIIGSFSNGIYQLDDTTLSLWNTVHNEPFIMNNIYSGALIGDQFAIGTIKDGLYILDEEGRLIQHINRSKGLQNNTILSIFSDKHYNLWLGLDNGIDFLKTSLPLSFINYNYNIETVYASLAYKNKLYVGTNQGLYVKNFNELSDPLDIEFDLVKNTEGQVWSLQALDGELLCGHNRGVFRIDNNVAINIFSARGVWNFFTLKGYGDHVFSGTYDGIIALKKGMNGHWMYDQTFNKGLDYSLRRIIRDEDNTIWISHDYEGIFRVKLSAALDSIALLQRYGESEGLEGPLPHYIHLFDRKFFVSNTEGNFVYNHELNEFQASKSVTDFFDGQNNISYLNEDYNGNIWYLKNGIVVLKRLLEDGTYTDITTPFLELGHKLVNKFENIYIYDRDNVFIGTEHGLVHYDPTLNTEYFYDTRTVIKEVTASSRERDSILSFKGNNPVSASDQESDVDLEYRFNTIKFKYACPDPQNADNILYSFRLSEYEDGWSEWSPATIKEYTNLPDGSYTFEVKAKSIYNNESQSDSFSFTIAAPVYRSTVAKLIYIVLMMGILALAFLLIRRRIAKVRSEEETKHITAFQEKEEKLHEQREAAENEVIKLRNDKLVANMKYKNKELANSTYHIIQKNKFLNALKTELSNLSKSAKSDFVEQELKKISRKIDRDINNKKHWEVFDRYFDEVHQEFLDRLTEKHPDLSPKEKRLSAYLRMNISTKEIAPLMNISVRGVEISRYRLRKKLNLNREANLTEYIMQI